MIDLHAHTLFSDGELLPSELVWRAKVKGYQAIALTDHTDFSNLDFIIPRTIKIAKILTREYKIAVIPGVELTYVPPNLIAQVIKKVKSYRKDGGIKIIVVHGETTAEPVPKGTNRAAILAKVDILAHPGLISEEDCQLAKKNNVYLELTSRKNHCVTNNYLSELAKKIGAKLILNTDTHKPEDLISDEEAKNILKRINLNEKEFLKIQNNAKEIIRFKRITTDVNR